MIRAAAIVSMLMILPASAQEVPRLDAVGHCERLFSESQGLKQVCLESQQESYNALKPVWASVPETVRAHCTRLFDSSYDLLKVCVESEMEAAGANDGFQFEY